MNPLLLYRPGALLSQPELCSARLDGLLFEIDDAYMPADIPEDADARVTALAPILSPGYAASGTTAAWLQGIGSRAPLRHHIQRTSMRRHRVAPHRDVVVHQVQLPEEDVQLISSTLVTTPLRTLTDLAIRAEKDTESRAWLLLVAQQQPHLVAVAIDCLETRSRVPGKRSALRRLNDLLESAHQDVVTRYTS
ncbi:hypothetical protein ACSS7Z_10060 [Microbacterium sp. A82]|uniref:hypothetical protein n=1 Tax=Microbacterium sp. A82 TaxID=3450452 RepID=UPI003F366AC9